MARRADIRYRAEPFATRLTVMVHRPRNAAGRGCPWFGDAAHAPPRPCPARPGLRAVWRVEEGAAACLFSSLAERERFCAVRSARVLPTPRHLALVRGRAALNGVWVARMAKPARPRRLALLRWIDRHDRLFRARIAEVVP